MPLFAATLVLLATPFVVGTRGDLIGAVFDTVDNGFRIGVVDFVVVDDALDDVFVAGLYNLKKSH